jgi:hypothetical protein
MKIYKLRLSKNQIEKFCAFAVMYHINILCSWSEETFFDTIIFLIISDVGGGGITTEEKCRLISEHYSNSILNDKPVNETT